MQTIMRRFIHAAAAGLLWLALATLLALGIALAAATALPAQTAQDSAHARAIMAQTDSARRNYAPRYRLLHRALDRIDSLERARLWAPIPPPPPDTATPPDTSAPPAPVDTVWRMVVSPDTVTIAVGGTATFVAREVASDGRSYTWDAASAGLTWTSSAPGVAAVAAGKVTGVAAGTARVVLRRVKTGMSDTALVVVTGTAPQPPPADTATPPPVPPNNPPPGPVPPTPIDTTGMKLLTDRPFHSYAATTSDRAGAEGWDPIEANSRARAAIVTDAAAPTGDATVLQITYPADFQSGTAPINAQIQSARWGGAKPRTLAVTMWVKISSNFSGNFSSTNKVVHFWVSAGGNRFFLSAEGQYMAPLEPQLRLQGTRILDTRPRLRPNVVPGFKLTRGAWQRWDILAIQNTPGQMNGVLQWWVDGQLVSDYRDVGFLSAGEATGWEQFQLSPTFGGGGPNVPADQWLWVDRIIVRGK